MDQLCIIYCPCPDQEQAQALGQKLLEARLAACINTSSPVDAAYWWQGSIEHSQEVILLVKTLAKHSDAVESMLADLHPYDCPCIMRLGVEKVNQDYLNWVKQECDA